MKEIGANVFMKIWKERIAKSKESERWYISNFHSRKSSVMSDWSEEVREKKLFMDWRRMVRKA